MLDISTEVAIVADSQRNTAAKRLASQFNLPLASKDKKPRFTLWLGPERLELHDRQKTAGPVYVEFTAGRALHRRRFGGGKNQPLARAIGIKDNPTVIDATAGLGRDSFVFATLGCKVIMLERSPILAALLADGLMRAELHAPTATIADRITLIHDDARDYLKKINDQDKPATIYLDPMYPHRKKSALVKKEMRIARELVSDDDDATELLKIAIDKTQNRVTVKRPIHAELLIATPKPDTQIRRKKTRYDIYFRKA